MVLFLNVLYLFLDRAANVCYQEFDVPAVFPIELKQYLPNIAYSYDKQRLVLLGIFPIFCLMLCLKIDIYFLRKN